MADAKIDEDLDLGIEKSSKKKLIIIIAAVLLLLIVGGVAGWFFLSGDEDSEEATEETVVEETLPPIYHALDPQFVVNLPPGGKAKMLQAGVQVMTRNAETVEFLKSNDPMIRHNLLNLFGEQEASSMSDRAGKEALQGKVLEILNKIIKDQSGPGEVEAVYFSSFVMQ